MLRQSADVVERKEFHPLLYKTMRALTAYAGEYADGGIHAKTGGAPPAPNSAHPTPNKFRRKDAAGAMRMRAVQPPGSGVDLAPRWLVEEVTVFSKQEHQRAERVAAELRRRQWKPKAGPKGDKNDHKGKAGGKGGKHQQGQGAQD